MKQPMIPRHEPEVVASASRPWGGDAEKVATTALKSVVVDGVDLSSRYGKAAEIDLMARVVAALTPTDRSLVESLFCDSKATCAYHVTLAPSPEVEVRRIARGLEAVLLEINGGHNGIDVSSGTLNLFLNPEWAGPSD